MKHVTKLPEITSIGLPPEKHADRIVGEMMQFLVAARVAIWPRIHETIGKMPDGNPGAQQKVYNAMRKAGGKFFLGGKVNTGKRGRYEIHLMVLEGWNNERRDVIHPDDLIPGRPWLTLNWITLTSKGRHRYDEETRVVLMFTHHALSRLAQRCGARTMDDIYDSVLHIGKAYLKIASSDVADHQRMKVELPGEMGTAVCVLRHHDDGKGGVLLATLWREGEEEECESVHISPAGGP